MNWKKLISLFTLIVLLVVVLVVVSSGAFQEGSSLRISALEDDEPVNIVFSDIKSDSFTVAWITEREVIGGILLVDGLRIMENERSSYHLVTVIGLDPSKSYQFKLLSGSREFGNKDGSDYLVKTAAYTLTDAEFAVYGQVFSPDGYSLQEEGIITLKLVHSELESQVLSAAINESGGFQVDMGGLLSKELNRGFSYKTKSEVIVSVYISHEEVRVEKRFPVNFSTNRQMPNIYMGDVNIDVLPAVEEN